MKAGQSRKRIAIGVSSLVLISIAAVVWINRPPEEETWKPAAEGFLAVATPCCEEASLWDDLSTEAADGQRPRAATVAEAAQWLNTWPYRDRHDDSAQPEPPVSMRSSEVRCVGAPTGPPVPRNDDDEETIAALRLSHECVYARWKVWVEETAQGQPNERHTVWADQDGFLHGRVDYWE